MPRQRSVAWSVAPDDPYKRFAYGYWAWMNWRLQTLETAAWREWWERRGYDG